MNSTKRYITSLVVGGLVGSVYYPALGLVIALAVVPTAVHVSSLWVGTVLESVVALFAISLVVGALLALLIKRWIPLVPYLAFVGFLVSVLAQYSWATEWKVFNGPLESLVVFRFCEAIVGGVILALVFRAVQSLET